MGKTRAGRLAAALAALAVLSVTACGGGHAVGHSASGASPTARSSATVSDHVLPVNLCTLIRWSDLGYPGITPGTPSPTQSGKLRKFDQSCFWASQQFDAGYTPPHSATCDNNTSDPSNALTCVGVDAKEFASIEANSKFVKLTIAYQGIPTSVSPVAYVQDGHPVYISDDPSSATCSGGLDWSHGILVIMNQDATKAFGPPCDEVKKVIALLIKREPR